MDPIDRNEPPARSDGDGKGKGEGDDPYLWLEEVTAERALAWVRGKNEVTVAKMEGDPGFARLKEDLLAILDSDEKIPYVNKVGRHYYNFWRDRDSERGLWRRTTFAEYRKPKPTWETVLDLDALAAAEGENWVWGGARCLRPDYTRCLVSLSRGGADASVVREFDLAGRRFVEGGFEVPEAKGGVGWIDRDTVFVYTDFGEGTLTRSGYPRQARRWRRGQPLGEAELVFEGRAEDTIVAAVRDHTPGHVRDFVYRAIDTYNNELFILAEGDEVIPIEAPTSASKGVHRQWLTLELRDPWEVGGRTYPAGALLVARLDAFLEGEREFEVLFEPTETTSLASQQATRDHFLLNVMDDVKNRVYVHTPVQQRGRTIWKKAPLAGAPDLGTVSVWAVDAEESNEFFMITTDYLTPTELHHGTIGRKPARLKQMPAFFDASDLSISQHFAASKDGTRVPYFQVGPKDLDPSGANPTVLYGYGGFEISQLPGYDPTTGRGWLAQGGVYVVANIRGGGEYGPRWHQAALKENRHRAYEDFAAVAEDLFARKVTSAAHLGVYGGSNGGLLVGNMLTHYPELFGAAVGAVPLLDMRRYHELLAGASWMAEYGDPDDPDQWRFIQTFSPYHNVRAGVRYPPVLFTTSTRDDRVHPGHARKMTARMEEQGHDVLYYENIEGGHGGAANNRQAAFMRALAYTYFKQRLFSADPGE